MAEASRRNPSADRELAGVSRRTVQRVPDLHVAGVLVAVWSFHEHLNQRTPLICSGVEDVIGHQDRRVGGVLRTTGRREDCRLIGERHITERRLDRTNQPPVRQIVGVVRSTTIMIFRGEELVVGINLLRDQCRPAIRLDVRLDHPLTGTIKES